MKNDFLRLLLKVLLLLFPLFLILFYWESQLRRIPNSYNFKRWNLEKNLDTLEILVTGSSHALYGINPDYFSCKGFNLANISQSMYYDAELALKYIDRLPKLKAVLITISYFSFGYKLEICQESWRSYYYNYFWGIKSGSLKWDDPKMHSLISLYSLRLTQSYALKNFKVNLAQDYQTNGWMRSEKIGTVSAINDSTGKERADLHTKNMRFDVFDENRDNLERLLRKLRKKGIASFFVIMPVYNTYEKFTDPAINKRNHELIEYFLKKYEIRCFDYSNDTRFEIKDFANNDHLNYMGADKLSKIINQEILSNYCR